MDKVLKIIITERYKFRYDKTLRHDLCTITAITLE